MERYLRKIQSLIRRLKDFYLDCKNEIACPYAPLDTPFTVICDKRIRDSKECPNCVYRDSGE